METLNVIYLYPKYYYDRKMSRGRVWYGEALSKIPGVNLKWWGPGWEGYDESRSLRENLKEHNLSPDLLWAYKPENIIGITDRDCPLLVCYNECWPHIPGKAKKEVEDCRADLVVYHHENDAVCFTGFKGLVGHIPHGAPRDLFDGPIPHTLRGNECLSSGVQSPEIYPLRYRLNSFVKNGSIPGKIRQHPGYRLNSAEECQWQAGTYAADLVSSCISLCCSSIYRYQLAKLSESALAGCLIVTDAPRDSWFELLRPYVLVVENGESDQSIINRINNALRDADSTQELALKAQAVALEHFTTERYASCLLAFIKDLI